ncbi:MAG TPA: response regulator [Vicinamibacterales bacterium]|nr:response regulator [Vicinamibacterales bacterium]
MATVLLVEDNEDVREMMSVALELAGIRVIAAANGRDALHVLETGTELCLILLDLMMPVMDGWQFRAILSKDPRRAQIPIVVVSAMTAEMALRMGATAYLPKPVDLDRLLEIVSSHCPSCR